MLDTETTAPPAALVTRAPGTRPLTVLASLAILSALSLAGWAVAIGAVWLLCVYTLATAAVLASAAVVGFCAWLALAGNYRARILSGVLFAALVTLVVWTVAK